MTARAEGTPPPEGSVTLEGATPEYRYETPRLPPGNVVRTDDRDIKVLLRLDRPVIALLESVLSAQECAELIEMARPRLRPSTVVDPQSGADTIAQYRNSEGMFFRPGENELVSRRDARIAAVSAWVRSWCT